MVNCLVTQKLTRLTRFENVERTRDIGSVSYGSIWQCKIGDDGTIYAMKEIPNNEEDSKDGKNNRINRVMVAASIGSHPNVVSYRRFLEDEYRFYMIMDCMKESFDSYIKNKRPLQEAAIISFTRQILKGLKHLHDEKVIHGDIKCKSVLVDEHGCVKLCNFGISTCQTVDTSKTAKKGRRNTQTSTHRYMAPELICPEKYGPKVDIWCFGVMMVEIITGKEPYPALLDVQPYVQMKTDNKVEYGFPPTYSRELKEFVNSCLVYNPDGRPTCAKLLQNKIFTK